MDASDHILSRKTTRRHDFLVVVPLFCALFCLFFTAGISPAFAFMGKDKIPPLSYKVTETVQDYHLRSDEYNITPLEDPALNFKVRLPQGWTPLDSDMTKGNIGGDIFRLLAVYTSPPNFSGRSQFRVRSLDINYLISADNWMVSYMLEMGFSLEGIHVFNRRKAEAQYTLFIDNVPYITRAVIELSGTRVVIAEYMVPQDRYNDEKNDQVLAMNSYDMLSPDLATAVDMKTYSFVDIARFDYPGTWDLIAPVITNIENMNATVANISDRMGTPGKSNGVITQLNGRIDISIIARRDGVALQDQVDFLQKEMSDRKIKVTKLLETVRDVEFKTLKGDVRVDVYGVEGTESKLVDHEYWGAILQTPGHFYLVRLITIGRLQNFKTWAENVETYRYILGSLSPNRDHLD